jgi:CheY-like chemotaxis protein
MAAERQSPEVRDLAQRTPRVAVIDDDDDFAAVMEAVIVDEGMGFVRSTAGPDAVEALAAAHADIAVLDLRGVGDNGGIDLLRDIRAEPRLTRLPVLVCSADVDQLRRRAEELSSVPHVAVLEKPFGIDLLTATLARLLAGAPTFPPAAAGRPDRAAVAALGTLLERIGRSLDWSVTDAWVPDTRPGLLRCAAAWSASSDLEPFVVVSRRIRLPFGGGLPGRVWASGRPHWAADLAGDLNFPRLPTAQRVGLVSAAAVPVTVGEAIAGIVAGYARRVRAHDPGALEALAAAADEAGPLLRAAAGMGSA